MSTLMEDAEALLKQVTAAINYAMPAVGDDIRACIAEHVQSDVYGDNGKGSAVYPRSYTLLRAAETAQTIVGGGHVIVLYEPQGAVSGTFGQLGKEVAKKYHKDVNDPIKPNPVSGDMFIRRIETGEGYDYKTDVGPRPFLKNAVEELIEGKRILRTFIQSANEYDKNIRFYDAGDVELTRDSGDFDGF